MCWIEPLENENVVEEEKKEESIHENNVSDNKDSVEIVDNENGVEENVVAEITPEGNVVDGRANKINVNVENANGETVTDATDAEQTGMNHLAEDDRIESNECADEIEQVDESDIDTERSSINDSDATPLQTTLVRKLEWFYFFFSSTEWNFTLNLKYFFVGVFSPNHVLLRSHPLDMLVFQVQVHQKLSFQPTIINSA